MVSDQGPLALESDALPIALHGPAHDEKMKYDYLGPIVQSIVSLTSSLRGQLVKCFTTL